MQLAEGAAGQKVAVKMVPASKAQQDAAQAAAAAKAPTTNGHAAPIEGLSAKERGSNGAAEASRQETRLPKGTCLIVVTHAGGTIVLS